MDFGFPTSHFTHGVEVDGSNMEIYAGYLDGLNIMYNQ